MIGTENILLCGIERSFKINFIIYSGEIHYPICPCSSQLIGKTMTTFMAQQPPKQRIQNNEEGAEHEPKPYCPKTFQKFYRILHGIKLMIRSGKFRFMRAE